MNKDDGESMLDRAKKAIQDEAQRKAEMEAFFKPLREAGERKQADLEAAVRLIEKEPDQKARRRMFDAIGLTTRSAAPRPIEPIVSDVEVRRRLLPRPPAPNWDKWGSLGSMSLWLAVSLSLDLEPDRMPVYHYAGDYGEDPFKICPEDFRHRLGAAVSHIGISIEVQPGNGDPAGFVVQTTAFRRLANQLGWSLPAGFQGTAPVGAETTPPAEESCTDPAKSETVVERQTRRLARFRQLGGAMIRQPGAWVVDKTGTRGALASLVREEADALRPRRDRKDISADLAAAAEREREGKG